MQHVDGGAADDGDVSEEVVLADDELVEFHEFQDSEECDDDFRLGGGQFEQVIERECFSWSEMIEEELDFIGHGEAVIDDVAEVVGFLEAFENVLEGADEIEDGNFREGGGFFGGFVARIGLVGEATLLIELAEGEEARGVFELFVFDELADEFPARIIILDVLFRRLFVAREKGSGFQVHQIGRHDDELGSEVDVQELERVDVIKILLGNFLDRDGVDIELVFFNKIEQEIERTLEDFELDFVIGVFQRERVRG